MSTQIKRAVISGQSARGSRAGLDQEIPARCVAGDGQQPILLTNFCRDLENLGVE